jgi:hypothetical protein
MLETLKPAAVAPEKVYLGKSLTRISQWGHKTAPRFAGARQEDILVHLLEKLIAAGGSPIWSREKSYALRMSS